MAVLSNIAVVQALESGRLTIDPRPSPPPGGKNTPFNTSSVDLRLAPEIFVPKQNLSLTFDLRSGAISKTLASVCDQERIPESGWLLRPNRLILGRTIERVALPIEGGLAARIEGRSSYARTGLVVHFTAPTIHAGFAGTITLEMINLGPISLTLTPGMRLCQLIVETVDGPIEDGESQFRGQGTAIGS